MSANHEERERLSWSEIDKRRDSGSYQKRPKKGEGDVNSPYSNQRAMSRYKAALENLFAPGKKTVKGEGGDKLKKLRETSDRQEFQNAANEFIKEHGLPHNWEDLENFLRHKDAGVLSETIRRMEQLLADQSETRIGNFKKDLQLISMTTRDRDLRIQVTQLLRQLGDAVP